MYQDRTTNRKINRLRERCLRIIYNNKQSSFKILLEKDSSVSIQKIVTFTICDLILSFPDLLFGLYFTGPKVCPVLVQLSGRFFLTVTKTYLILVFLKTRLKNKNLKIVAADFPKDTFLESALHRLFLAKLSTSCICSSRFLSFS